MGIQNFPAALQPIIQQGFLQREFQSGLQSRLGFRAIADREDFPNKIGETITKTRKGLKAPVETPLNPTTNTNLDNGLTPSGWTVEQYTLGINMYGDTIDLNMVTQGVGIAKQFAANAKTNGVQAMQSLDRIARNVLYAGYLGGNTRVRTTLGAPATTVAVDDIRGFQYVMVNGVMVPVSSSNPMTVTVGAGVYQLTGATPDGSNVSAAPKGVSGTLQFSANVSTSDGTAGNGVVSAVAPVVLRTNGRASTAALQAGDTLQMQDCLSAVATLRSNNVPDINGLYNCYLDDKQLLGLFKDPDFKLLYRGAYGSETYKTGQIIELLGLRFIPTNEAPQQASLGAGAIHRALICGQGALVEGDYVSTGYSDIPEAQKGLIEMVDAVCMVTREPLDRLQQIIAQSWYWIGGFALPTDVTANANIIPTATNSYLKRGVVIESL
ncbi:DUF4043 domain-containing protein [Chromobacterium violaceum]|uniref:DUF4043 domain-containing protein n=1 Tax=Chromobacterium violaceum TaxID=536 RepID=A0A202B2I1_CHRVL|nr:DUF4043 domain-containing protein [Chromobacterium violaceum]OVE45669.1 DUF4043 domain-containing protein [Chromobacterium violaceum]